MNTDQTQRPSMPDEPPVGSGPDKITQETPRCEKKSVRCNFWTPDGCSVICWVEKHSWGRRKARYHDMYLADQANPATNL